MRRNILSIVSIATLFLVLAASGQASKVTWHGMRTLAIEGKGWEDTKDFYDRLPARAEKVVRPPVWNLSLDSAGMCARFVTDAESISVKWILRKDLLSMPHMPASGVSGLDLYVKEEGKWRWLGAARPKQSSRTNEAVLVKNLPKAQREYLLYLPLYNGVNSVDIGVPSDTQFVAAPSRDDKKPVVFYGTSILQGGCASRPGLAYPAIIGRMLDWPVINLGFSGNAKSEPELADLLSELDPSVYVLDPVPNMDAAMVAERIEPMVRKIRSAHPKTPIVLVQSLSYTDGYLEPVRRERYTSANDAMRTAYRNLKKSGVKKLYFISGEDLIGDDGEGTVDGTHPNDLGFMRMAEEIGPVVRRLLR